MYQNWPSMLMSTTSTFWYIHERAYETPCTIRDSHKHAHICTKTDPVSLMSTTSTFWYIHERAYETPQYGILISTPIYVPKLTQYAHEHDQHILVYTWACLWDTTIRDSHKHAHICAKTDPVCSRARPVHFGIYMSVLMRHHNTGFS